LATAKQHDVRGKDLHPAAGLAFLLPPVLPKLAFYSDLLAFDQVLVEGFRTFPPQDDIEEMGLVHPLVVLFPSLVDGYAELAYRGAAVCVLELCVPGQSPHENNMVDICHTDSLGS
jgi:hypothetical protein